MSFVPGLSYPCTGSIAFPLRATIYHDIETWYILSPFDGRVGPFDSQKEAEEWREETVIPASKVWQDKYGYRTVERRYPVGHKLPEGWHY